MVRVQITAVPNKIATSAKVRHSAGFDIVPHLRCSFLFHLSIPILRSFLFLAGPSDLTTCLKQWLLSFETASCAPSFAVSRELALSALALRGSV